MKKSSLQYGMKFSIENEIFILGPSLAAEKQGLGLKFSIENEIFKPRMKFSIENKNFVRWGNGFFMRSSENEFFRSPGPLGRVYTTTAGPLFLRLSPDPEVTEQKKLWCIPFSWGKGKRVYTIGPERRVYTIEPQTRKRKKMGVLHGGGVYFFLPCSFNRPEFSDNSTRLWLDKDSPKNILRLFSTSESYFHS